ncbi:type III polyketide synthase [Rosenbergiella sp. S61]|uniref:Type III polyketide synthase n=1 Tax=Rosenbergiella gaditana TaxID=2726987 RepID=A0ABS5T2N3_9GAMM|nr:type III polyketide synthase [Rosenbergiella gaditana]MBT0725702.1 type III polyketide synthase [Rosenbergiella gaditana]
MPTLHKPAIFLPDNIITLEETLDFAKKEFKNNPILEKALKLITNTGVKKRHLIQPIELSLQHPGFGYRNSVFELESKKHVPSVVIEALENAHVKNSDISAIIYVSCSGFMMPSLTAWLINKMGFNNNTVQIPIAQLGCAAGGAAINRAHDFILAHPGANVLIVSCEFCSLSYQPTDNDIGSLLSDGLFGDAITAAVVTSEGGSGIDLQKNSSYLIPDTDEWIRYDVKDTGFHFRLDKRVPGTMEPLAPVMRELTKGHGWDIEELDYYIIHAGGPRILDDLCKYLRVKPEKFDFSRDTLVNCGNIASSVVFEAYRRMCEENYITHGDKGIIAGFGPGITAEMNLSLGK